MWRSICDVPIDRSLKMTINMDEATDGKNYIFGNEERGGHHERVQGAHRCNALGASN